MLLPGTSQQTRLIFEIDLMAGQEVSSGDITENNPMLNISTINPYFA
jgi:hypothetical protein